MAENSAIEWTDHTFNPWEGCTKVSPGCAHCYAETRNHRFGMDNWGKGKPRRRTSEDNWKKPLKWNKASPLFFCPRCNSRFYDPEALGRPYCCPNCGLSLNVMRDRVFCASLADIFDAEVPIEWLVDLLVLIGKCLNLDWLLLTKRPQNWQMRLAAATDYMLEHDIEHGWVLDWLTHKAVPANIWVGTTIEDQTRLDERKPLLEAIPARVRFYSVEPMLGAIDLKLTPRYDWAIAGGPNECPHGYAAGIPCQRCKPNVHWVICGGESGPGARPMNEGWAYDIRWQCERAGVPFFMKQGSSANWPAYKDFSRFAPAIRVRQFPIAA